MPSVRLTLDNWFWAHPAETQWRPLTSLWGGSTDGIDGMMNLQYKIPVETFKFKKITSFKLYPKRLNKTPDELMNLGVKLFKFKKGSKNQTTFNYSDFVSTPTKGPREDIDIYWTTPSYFVTTAPLTGYYNPTTLDRYNHKVVDLFYSYSLHDGAGIFTEENLSDNNIYNINIRSGVLHPWNPYNKLPEPEIYATNYTDPYIIIEYVDIQPLPPTGLTPSISANPKMKTTFRWAHTPSSNALEDPYQSSQMRHRKKGTSTYTVVNTTDQFHTIPANTYQLGDVIEWNVRTSSQYNGWSNWSSAEYETKETPPMPPDLIYPKRRQVNALQPVVFEWEYKPIIEDDYQSKFDLEIDVANEIEKISEITTNNLYYHEPFIYTQRINWRVRCYNSLGDTGLWSEWEAFSTVGMPAPGNIVRHTNTNKPIFTITIELGQYFFFEILHNGEVIYSSSLQSYASQFEYPEFLDNGSYVARIKTQSAIGLQSDWNNYPFNISTVPFANPEIQIVRNSKFGVNILIEKHHGDTLYISRDGKFIDKLIRTDYSMPYETLEYIDYTAIPNKWHYYRVLSVRENVTVWDNPAKEFHKQKHGKIDFNEFFLFDKQSGRYCCFDVVDISVNKGANGKSNYYSGRNYQIKDYDGTYFSKVDVAGDISYEQFAILETLLDKTVFAKQTLFGGMWANISEFDVVLRKMNTVNISFSLEQTEDETNVV